MKRCLSHGFIMLYLGTVVFGVAAHAIQFRSNSHPLMYYIVWDMFCGWSAWEQRIHVVGEGESGTLYELAPGPWADYQPFGDVSRQNYDPFLNHVVRMGVNSVRHTDHEPIRKIYVFEEVWQKKFNLPEPLRDRLNPVPGELQSRFHLRYVCAGDGTVREKRPSWFDTQIQMGLMNNPRLQQLAARNTNVYVTQRAR